MQIAVFIMPKYKDVNDKVKFFLGLTEHSFPLSKSKWY